MNLNNWTIINNRLFKGFRSVQPTSQNSWPAHIHLRSHFVSTLPHFIKIWLWKNDGICFKSMWCVSHWSSILILIRKENQNVLYSGCYWLGKKKISKNNLKNWIHIKISYMHHSFPTTSSNGDILRTNACKKTHR